eukprot:scaffold3553_cov19-Tisochrysis_lutea.AAC.1
MYALGPQSRRMLVSHVPTTGAEAPAAPEPVTNQRASGLELMRQLLTLIVLPEGPEPSHSSLFTAKPPKGMLCWSMDGALEEAQLITWPSVKKVGWTQASFLETKCHMNSGMDHSYGA